MQTHSTTKVQVRTPIAIHLPVTPAMSATAATNTPNAVATQLTGPWRWILWSTLSIFVVVALQVTGSAEEPQKGLHVDDKVPITSMRWVIDKFGKPIDKNTCLAGKYRDRRTISIYVRSIKEPQLNSLLKQVDALLADKREFRGYVLFVDGDQFDDVLKRTIGDWAKDQKFANLDMAIANSDPAKEFGFVKETSVVVIYSENLQVKYTRDYATDKMDEAAVKDLARQLEELSR